MNQPQTSEQQEQQLAEELWIRGNYAWEESKQQRAAELFYQAGPQEPGRADFSLALYTLSNDPQYLLLAAEEYQSLGCYQDLYPLAEQCWYRPSFGQGQAISDPGDLIRARDLWLGQASEQLDDFDHQPLNDLTRATLALRQGQYRQVLAITEGLDIPGFRSDLDLLLGAALLAADLPEVGAPLVDRALDLGLSPEGQQLAEDLLAANEDFNSDILDILSGLDSENNFNQIISGFYCCSDFSADSGSGAGK